MTKKGATKGVIQIHKFFQFKQAKPLEGPKCASPGQNAFFFVVVPHPYRCVCLINEGEERSAETATGLGGRRLIDLGEVVN